MLFGLTATAGQDFYGLYQIIEFPAGSDSASVTVPVQILNDDIGENLESFRVRLFHPTNGLKLSANRVLDISIEDDDANPQ